MKRSITPFRKLLWLAWLACPVASPGEPVLVPANPEAGFHFPYVLAVPAGIEAGESVTLVVETNNTGPRDDFEETLAETLKDAEGRGLGPMLSRYMELPLVMPVFPRTKSGWQLYTHALDRDTMEVQEGSLARLDRQLLAMVADARHRLTADGLQPKERFVMVGFSASGSFANRFAFLHPGRLAAVVAGGVNAFPMLPVDERNEQVLNFPLGIHDIDSLTGEPFDAEGWKSLPQMIFMGALDDNDAVLYDDAYSDAERAAVFAAVGRPMHERWLASQKIYLESGANANLITFGQVGHWTDRLVGLSIVNFLENALTD
jgi:pimeloyl-ACP methyl ester carboxylesterase